MKGVFDSYKMKIGEEIIKGNCSISAFEYSRKEDRIGHVRNVLNGMPISDGKYIRLTVNNQLMMSDTDMEKNSNFFFCMRATGKVLIAGLGIGLILKNIESKLSNGEISEVVIIEKHKDVIDLVYPFWKHPKIKVINADITNWRPEKGETFDTIYFDIWPTIDGENYLGMQRLHRAFKPFLSKNPNSYMGSWMQSEMRKLHMENKRWERLLNATKLPSKKVISELDNIKL